MPHDTLVDIYDLLGVPHNADAPSIRRGYREKVRALRLDLAEDPEAGDRLHELTHAYEVLSNPSSRLLYDQFALGGGAEGRVQPVENGERTPGRQLARIGGDDLIAWVLGREPQQNGSTAAALPAQDRLVRYVASVGFVVALVFLVALLLHG